MATSEILRPHWLKDSMTIRHAAMQADIRGYTLKLTWHGLYGVRVVAIPKENENET